MLMASVGILRMFLVVVAMVLVVIIMLVLVVEEMLMMVVVKKISKQFLLPKIDYYFNIGSQYY